MSPASRNPGEQNSTVPRRPAVPRVAASVAPDGADATVAALGRLAENLQATATLLDKYIQRLEQPTHDPFTAATD